MRHIGKNRLLEPAGLIDFEDPAGYHLDETVSILDGDQPQVILRAG